MLERNLIVMAMTVTLRLRLITISSIKHAFCKTERKMAFVPTETLELLMVRVLDAPLSYRRMLLPLPGEVFPEMTFH